MPTPRSTLTPQEAMAILSFLVLSPSSDTTPFPPLSAMTREQFDHLLALAHSNHVVVRAFEVFRRLMTVSADIARAQWAAEAVAAEQARIAHVLTFINPICEAFTSRGQDVTVMKSLDHWPDFGSDLDLYTNTSAPAVCALMQESFSAAISARSWGDRLAGKWNFEIPGLPEAVEVHAGRLGQTGEQLVLAAGIAERARTLTFQGHAVQVPSPSDRIMISTLQRMYRHFYFRLCDIVDSAQLVQSGLLDYNDLRHHARAAGIWEGVATYLGIVSEYAQRYGRPALGLPDFVTEAARFPGSVVYVGGIFLRVPILPQSASLYRTQLVGLIRKGDVESSARLGVLPWLATAAAIGHKITGSDKGIW